MERLERAHYAVVGTRRRDLLACMALNAPRCEAGRYAAYTAWRVTWTYACERRGDRFAIATPAVTLAAQMMLPSWRPAPTAPVELVREWQRYVAALAAHEDEHMAIARAARLNVERRLEALTASPTLSDLHAAADAAAGIVLSAARDREHELDRLSEHGRRDGACFREV
jgi:predicted secreted Zn-dependent protease